MDMKGQVPKMISMKDIQNEDDDDYVSSMDLIPLDKWTDYAPKLCKMLGLTDKEDCEKIGMIGVGVANSLFEKKHMLFIKVERNFETRARIDYHKHLETNQICLYYTKTRRELWSGVTDSAMLRPLSKID